MPTTQETVAAYGAAWNEPDKAKRRALLEQAWADDGLYVDPVAEVKGRDEVLAMIAAFQKQSPGSRIELTSGIDQHHSQIRFAWALTGPDGKTVIEGIDAGEIAADGRIARIIGFWGQPPAK